MTRHDFYDNLNKYLSLQHSQSGPSSNTNKYYAKLDKFYPDGRPRYFYSKAEWDAYQKNKGYEQNTEKDKANKKKSNITQEEKLKKERAELSKKTTSDRDTAIQKAYKDEQKRREEENLRELYKYKNEIVEKANEYFDMASEEINDFLDKFMEDFPPELRDKVLEIMDKIKDSVEDIIEKIDNISEEEIANIYGFIDKIVDKVQDEISKYSDELNEIYQKVKHEIKPVFKNENGNIDWKLYLAVRAGLGVIGFIMKNPELCVRTLGKIYDTTKKTLNFVNEKTNGAFSRAMHQIARKLENYSVYKNLEKQGLGEFTVPDGNGGRITYLDQSYNNWLKASGQK